MNMTTNKTSVIKYISVSLLWTMAMTLLAALGTELFIFHTLPALITITFSALAVVIVALSSKWLDSLPEEAHSNLSHTIRIANSAIVTLIGLMALWFWIGNGAMVTSTESKLTFFGMLASSVFALYGVIAFHVFSKLRGSGRGDTSLVHVIERLALPTVALTSAMAAFGVFGSALVLIMGSIVILLSMLATSLLRNTSRSTPRHLAAI